MKGNIEDLSCSSFRLKVLFDYDNVDNVSLVGL